MSAGSRPNNQLASTTAAVPLSTSQTSVAAASPLRPVRSTLVAPMLPEPIARMSCVPAKRVSNSPNGIEPRMYPSTSAAKYPIQPKNCIYEMNPYQLRYYQTKPFAAPQQA